MKILVCGGRDYDDKNAVFSKLDALQQEEQNFSYIIHGGASGADNLAHEYSIIREVKSVCFPAQWSKFGRAAGPIRNKQMLDIAKPDLVVAFPGGRGTKNMITLANQYNIKTIIVS